MQFSRLPVRPLPVEGESIRGLLMRIAQTNGIDSVDRLFQAVGASPRNANSFLQQYMANCGRKDTRLIGYSPGVDPATPLFRGLTAQDFNMRHRRWCPQCLREQDVLMGTWNLKLVCVCPRHLAWLRDACPSCGQVQKWEGVNFMQCICGAPLAESEKSPANLPTCQLTSVLLGDTTALCALAAGPDLQALNAPDMHRLVRYLGLFGAGEYPQRPGQSSGLHELAIARKYVQGTTHLFTDWPRVFNEVLADRQAKAHRLPDLRKSFDPLYTVLYQDLPGNSFQFLRTAFEDYLGKHWPRLVCKRNHWLGPQTVAQHPRLTVKQAAKQAGVQPAVVRHLAQAAWIQPVTVPYNCGRRSTLLHQVDVSRIADIATEAMTLKAAARQLALPPERVRELIQSGLVRPAINRYLNLGASAWLIPAAEIDAWFVVSNDHEQPLSSLRSVHDVLQYGRLQPGEAVAILRAVKNSELRVFGQGDAWNRLPIGEAKLCTDKLNAWLGQRRRGLGTPMSIDQAAHALGVKQQVAYSLVRTGLLSFTTDAVLGHRVSMADIEVFRAEFVSLVSLAKTARTSPKALIARLNVTPVAGPSIDGCRQYFFRRSDIVRLRSSWLADPK